jgi:hypothetical protein
MVLSAYSSIFFLLKLLAPTLFEISLAEKTLRWAFLIGFWFCVLKSLLFFFIKEKSSIKELPTKDPWMSKNSRIGVLILIALLLIIQIQIITKATFFPLSVNDLYLFTAFLSSLIAFLTLLTQYLSLKHFTK